MQVPLLDLKAQYAKIKGEVLAAVSEVLDSQVCIGGAKVTELEGKIAAVSDCKFAVGASSGTDAILNALMSLEIGSGDEVITTPFTFFATVGSIVRTGAKPVFVDIDPETYTMDPNQLEDYLRKRFKVQGSRSKAANSTVRSVSQPSAISPQSSMSSIRSGKPKAVLPVHLYGHPADMEGIRSVASRYDLLAPPGAGASPTPGCPRNSPPRPLMRRTSSRAATARL